MSNANAAESPEDISPTLSADKTDRYVSFKGIDCEGNNEKLLAMVFRHIDDPAKNNAFWDKFRAEVAAADNIYERKFDGLCIVCARVAIISELFEEYEDEEGLAMLEKIEHECC